MPEIYYNDTDTICAIATPGGCGGIAVVRISGPDAITIADSIWSGRKLSLAPSHTVHLGNILEPDGNILDNAVATVFRAPKSYTGQDTVELSVHGSPWIQSRLLQILIDKGARMALPGEYTRRAYASGRIDLTQAEAVADLIAATSPAAHRVAINQLRGGVSNRLEQLRQKLLHFASLVELELDFSDQDVEFVPRNQLINLADEIDRELTTLINSFSTGSAIKKGFPVVITGAVNTGKSMLLNTLLEDDRAIVSDIAGTTRDIIEDTRQIGDYTIRFVDTAGLRHTTDAIENIGIDRARKAAAAATTVLYTIDSSNPASIDQIKETLAAINADTLIVVLTKCDLTAPAAVETLAMAIGDNIPQSTPICPVAAINGTGIPHLLQTITRTIARRCPTNDQTMITAARHAEALTAARTSNARAIDALKQGIPADLIAQDLRETLHHLSEITGAITTPQILNNIFSHFCVGK